jgi:protein CpxP
MEMKKRTLTLAAFAIASLGWISTAAAQPPEGGRMRRPGGPGGPGFGPGESGGPGRIAEQLGLTDEQKTQWKAIHEKERATAEPLMKAAMAAKEAFDKTLESDSADAASVGQAALAMRDAHRKLEAAHAATFEAVKAILTPEQLAKLEESQKHMRRPGPDGPGEPGRPRRGPGPGGAK